MSFLFLYGARMCIPGYEECPIKLGITSAPDARRKGLQASMPFPLEWLGEWPAKRGRRDEQEAFNMFAEQRLGGEWFTPSPFLLSFIAGNARDYQFLLKNCRNKWGQLITGRSAEVIAHGRFAGRYYGEQITDPAFVARLVRLSSGRY